jgi:hypothetical protein
MKSFIDLRKFIVTDNNNHIDKLETEKKFSKILEKFIEEYTLYDLDKILDKEIHETLSIEFILVRDNNGTLNIPRTKESFHNTFSYLMASIGDHFLHNKLVIRLLVELFSEEFPDKNPDNCLSKRYIIFALLQKLNFDKANFDQIANQMEDFFEAFVEDNEEEIRLVKCGTNFRLINY